MGSNPAATQIPISFWQGRSFRSPSFPVCPSLVSVQSPFCVIKDLASFTEGLSRTSGTTLFSDELPHCNIECKMPTTNWFLLEKLLLILEVSASSSKGDPTQ